MFGLKTNSALRTRVQELDALEVNLRHVIESKDAKIRSLCEQLRLANLECDSLKDDKATFQETLHSIQAHGEDILRILGYEFDGDSENETECDEAATDGVHE